MDTTRSPNQKVTLAANGALGTIVEVSLAVNDVPRYRVRYVLDDKVVRDLWVIEEELVGTSSASPPLP